MVGVCGGRWGDRVTGRTFRIALSTALRRLATWADPYPGRVKAPPPHLTLVTYDANGKRVLISVPADRVQYVVTTSYPTHEDFERDRERRVEL